MDDHLFQQQTGERSIAGKMSAVVDYLLIPAIMSSHFHVNYSSCEVVHVLQVKFILKVMAEGYLTGSWPSIRRRTSSLKFANLLLRL